MKNSENSLIYLLIPCNLQAKYFMVYLFFSSLQNISVFLRILFFYSVAFDFLFLGIWASCFWVAKVETYKKSYNHF